MGSEELAANLFRITQTEAKLKRENITGESNVNDAHYSVGQNVREAIQKMVELCQKIIWLQKNL